MKLGVLAFGLSVSLPGSALAQQPPQDGSEPVAASAAGGLAASGPFSLAAIEQARTVLDGSLIDYPGTRFRNVRAVIVDATEDHTARPIKAVVFCGEVNAPNRMGGMGGWVPFMLRPDTSVFPFMTARPGIGARLHPSCVAGAGDVSDQTDYSSALTASR